jgi:Ca2+/Na+ antiporter
MSTPEGRQKKIEVFRRRRSFLFAGIILTLCWVFLFNVPWLDIFLVVVFYIGFVVVDSQIKTLLLYDKTQTK